MSLNPLTKTTYSQNNDDHVETVASQKKKAAEE